KKHGRRTDGSFSMTEQQYKQLMEGKGQLGWSDMVVDEITYANDREAFKAFFMTPIGGLLCITIDQLCHIACLIPVVWLMMPCTDDQKSHPTSPGSRLRGFQRALFTAISVS